VSESMVTIKNSLNMIPANVQNEKPIGPPNELTDEAAKKRIEAEKVAQDFETMFVELMVKSMRQTAQREDLSNAEDIYQGMLDSEYSKGMAASRSFGIKEQVLNWLEQTNPQLKQQSSGASTSDVTPPSADAQKLRNEALALKAATQAYQLSSGSR
jgi:peptidoglycan hydrolase FlgJ